MRCKNLKEEIQEFQQQNGNVSYTTKELIQGLHVKMDKMKTDFTAQPGKCASKFVTQDLFSKAWWVLFVLIGALAGYTIYLGI